MKSVVFQITVLMKSNLQKLSRTCLHILFLLNTWYFFLLSEKKINGFYVLCTFVEAIYKTRNTGTGNRMRGMQGTRGMFTRIPGNLLEDSGECSHFSIPGNIREDSRECY